ncbi:MAG: response regulator [Deltaproteobacteria bacterium]|nr:response regulator [Deltaproteobacteria bacterium]
MATSAALDLARRCGAPLGTGPLADLAQELSDRLPELRARLAVVAADSSGGEALAGELRALGARAAREDADLLALELCACEAVLRGAGLLGSLGPAEVAQIEQSLARIETSVGGGGAEPDDDSGPLPVLRGRSGAPPVGAADEAASRPEPGLGQAALPLSVLVVGPQAVAQSLAAAEAAGDGGRGIEVEHAEPGGAVIDLCRALAPDAIVVDTEAAGARELIAELHRDSLTGSASIVALGDWKSPEQAAPLLGLGAARALAKPASPRALRRACLELAAGADRPAAQPIGRTTLDGLGARLAEELQRLLCDAAESGARGEPIDLGDGGEVLATLWTAAGRIRDRVTARSGGAVRFEARGPEQALPAATWLSHAERREANERTPALCERRRHAPEATLRGKTVLLAEDDLSVNWFLSGVLREAGAGVEAAFDGARALEWAYRSTPDLVLSDILMPGLDGLALCRACKRDVLLRDVPVVLLSWKEDLLQRARELGAGADGYLRKEATGEDVVRRAIEVLAPRQRVAARIAAGGEVRGRLDGLTAVTLLRLVAAGRPDARICLRDALDLYEIELRAGRPVCATRTAPDGGSERGVAVLGAMLGVGAGRFGVWDAGPEACAALAGPLDELLREPVARVRAAEALLSGTALARVARVRLDEQATGRYLAATPEPSRGLVHALAGGASPAALLSAGKVSAELLQSVLCDAVRRGAVLSIADAAGGDLLPAAVERELAVLQDAPGQPAAREAYGPFALSLADLEGELPPPTPSFPPVLAMPGASEPPPAGSQQPPPVRPDPAPAYEALPAGEPPAQAPDEDLGAALAQQLAVEQPQPPVAVVLPGPESAVSCPVPPGPPPAVCSPSLVPKLTSAPVASCVEPPVPAPVPSTPAAVSAACWEQEPPSVWAAAPHAPAAPRVPGPSAYATLGAPEARPRRRTTRLALPVIFGIAGVCLAIGARFLREQQGPPPSPPAPAEVAAGATEPPGAATGAGSQDPSPGAADEPVELPLAKGDQVGPTQGLLEVVAGKGDRIFVDGKLIGSGPAATVTLEARPKPVEVRVKLRGEERVRYVAIKKGVRLRVRVAPPWSR